MAEFPTVYPASVTIQAGRMTNTLASFPTGSIIPFRNDLGKRDVLFSLVYQNETNTNAELIRSHYQDHFDTGKSFTVPRAVLSGTGVVSETALFYYDSAIQETQRGLLLTDLTVELRAVDEDNAFLKIDCGNGADRTAATVSKTKADLSTYLFSGTDPFVLDADDAVPATSAVVSLDGGKASL